MQKVVYVVGAGLAGSECALQLAQAGFRVRLAEMRPAAATGVHVGGDCAELVCSNSLKSMKGDSAAGMLKAELAALGSRLYDVALRTRVAAGGALAVDRRAFAREVTARIEAHPMIELRRAQVLGVAAGGGLRCVAADGAEETWPAPDALVLACGPLTGDALAGWLQDALGTGMLAFFDAAAPIVMADSLDAGVLFRQDRYKGRPAQGQGPEGGAEGDAQGDYLNAPFTKDEYERFIDELLAAERVVARDFETRELFQACQPIEEVARAGRDAPRFGAMKPVGLTDPRTGRRPWAAVQLRAEDAAGQSYNLVGFQTNLTFPEQRRVFRMIPGLQNAEFARLGVMHRNTFVDTPRVLDAALRLKAPAAHALPPTFLCGQLSGTEGYCEAMRSGLHAAIGVSAALRGIEAPALPATCAFGALLRYATDPGTTGYQPMHVNFGIIEPLGEGMPGDATAKGARRKAKRLGKRERYAAYAARGGRDLAAYAQACRAAGLLPFPPVVGGAATSPAPDGAPAPGGGEAKGEVPDAPR